MVFPTVGAVGASPILENFVHVASGVSSWVLSVVLVGFCLDVVFLFVGGVLTCCQVLFWGSGVGENLWLYAACVFLGISASCHGWFLLLVVALVDLLLDIPLIFWLSSVACFSVVLLVFCFTVTSCPLLGDVIPTDPFL